MERSARVADKPGADPIFLMRRRVGDDHTDRLGRRHLAFDAVEKAAGLLMTVALHVLADDRSIRHTERGEESRRAMAF